MMMTLTIDIADTKLPLRVQLSFEHPLAEQFRSTAMHQQQYRAVQLILNQAPKPLRRRSVNAGARCRVS